MSEASTVIYRQASIGSALSEALDNSSFSESQKQDIQQYFDKAMVNVITSRAKGKLVLKGEAKTFSSIEGIYTFNVIPQGSTLKCGSLEGPLKNKVSILIGEGTDIGKPMTGGKRKR